MTKTTQSYKNYRNGARNRVQTSETGFSAGMYFTEQPLDTGKTRFLINTDIDPVTGSLHPRTGFKLQDTWELHKPTDISREYTCIFHGTWGDFRVAVFNSYCRDNAGMKSFMSIQKLDSSDTPVTVSLNDTMYTAQGYIFQGRYHFSTIEFEQTTLGEFHNITKYYSIDLVEAYANPSAVVVETYSPRVLNPTEAYNWGYNMLAEDPYTFACETRAELGILGVVPYEETASTIDKIQLNPRLNQDIKLKAYYSAPSNWKSASRSPVEAVPRYRGTITHTTQLPDVTASDLQDFDAYYFGDGSTESNTRGRNDWYSSALDGSEGLLCNTANKDNTAVYAAYGSNFTEILSQKDNFIKAVETPQQNTLLEVTFTYEYLKEVKTVVDENTTLISYKPTGVLAPPQTLRMLGNTSLETDPETGVQYSWYTYSTKHANNTGFAGQSVIIKTELPDDEQIFNKYSYAAGCEFEIISTKIASETEVGYERALQIQFISTSGVFQTLVPYLKFYVTKVTKTAGGYIFYNYRWNYVESLTTIDKQTILLNPSTEAEDPIKQVWEWREAGSSDWVKIQEVTEKLTRDGEGNPLPLSCKFNIATENVIVRLSLYDPVLLEKDAQNKITNKLLVSTTIGITALTARTEQTANIVEPVNYDLTIPMKQVVWGSRIVKYYGLNSVTYEYGTVTKTPVIKPEFQQLLFVSSVNSPDYFPYPNGVDSFDEPIIDCKTYGDALLVFTRSKLYKLTYNTTDQGWTKSLIQVKFSIDTTPSSLLYKIQDNNVNDITLEQQFGVVQVSQQDAIYTEIRQYAAYQSNGRIFMILPNKTTTSNVTLAPISNSVKDLFDYNLAAITNIIEQMLKIHGTEVTLQQLETPRELRLHSDYDHIIYTQLYQDNAGHILCAQLRYDINMYAWNIYIFEVDTPKLYPVYYANTKAIYYEVFATRYGNNGINSLINYRFMQHKTEVTDERVENTDIALPYIFKNYQCIDLGNREINSDIRKRFREWQLKFVNPEVTTLQFYTNFYIDNRLRNTFQGLETSTKSTADGDGFEVVINETYTPNATYVPNVRIASGAILASPDPDAEYLTDYTSSAILDNVDAWEIGLSSFDTVPFIKVRKPVSGKGYTPRLVIFSFNEKRWELLNSTWVYRTMTSD